MKTTFPMRMASISTSHALLPPPALHPTTAQSPAATAPTAPSALLSCSSSPSSLSPEAHLLVPSGRSKAQRWEDSSPSAACAKESSPPRPSYRDVLAPRPATAARVLKSQSATAARVLNSQSAARVSLAAPPPRPALRSELSFCSMSCPRQRLDPG
jgi:hypothetical protein